MAATYWDYDATDPSSGTALAGDNYSSTYTITSTTTTGQDQIIIWMSPPREILVEHPENWTEEDHAAYVRLVNRETNTGWRVKMLMKGGDIRICDPNIEIRKMKDFVPLLKDRASQEDRRRVDDFFKEHPA